MTNVDYNGNWSDISKSISECKNIKLAFEEHVMDSDAFKLKLFSKRKEVSLYDDRVKFSHHIIVSI